MSYTSRLKKVPVLAVVLILLALAAGAAGTVSGAEGSNPVPVIAALIHRSLPPILFAVFLLFFMRRDTAWILVPLSFFFMASYSLYSAAKDTAIGSLVSGENADSFLKALSFSDVPSSLSLVFAVIVPISMIVCGIAGSMKFRSRALRTLSCILCWSIAASGCLELAVAVTDGTLSSVWSGGGAIIECVFRTAEISAPCAAGVMLSLGIMLGILRCSDRNNG